MRRSVLSGLAVMAVAVIVCQAVAAQEPPADRMRWFHDAKFGMFIHWGVYSQAGGEWKGTTNHAEWLQLTAKIPLAEYVPFAKRFNPVQFNADAWAQLAADAGMKYMVITSKHHDGFAMFDSPSNPYNIVKATAFARDPLKELADACRKHGLKFCVYYSLGRDWHDPDVPTGSPGNPKFPPGSRSNLLDYPDESKKDFSKYFQRKVKPQVRELLTQYGPIGIMWFDTPEKISRAQSLELRAMIRQLQPDCIINSRVGHGLGDYGTPEQQIPSAKSDKAWETCMTLNGHWGYNSHDQKWKSTEMLLDNLVDIVSKGGNYLLNVGPTGEGVIPQPSVKRLHEIGGWLKVNGEAIYGAGMTPFGRELGTFSDTKKDKKTGGPLFIPGDQWRCTTKPGKFYFFLLKWPGQEFTIADVKGRAVSACLLADPGRKPLRIAQNGAALTVSLPVAAPGKYVNVLCVDVGQ
jgi:alpha-L-fucosidase